MSFTKKESRLGDPGVIRVFVSSTWHDLLDERRAVETALHRLRETQFVGMEYFGSKEDTPRDVSIAKLDECQLYVGIIAGRFGSGITEDEYHHAGALGIPRHVYRKQAPVWMESDPGQQARLQEFMDGIATTHSEFTTPDDLALKVATGLHDWLVENVYKPAMREAGFAADLANAHLSPEPVYERLDLARFTGREWLRKEVDDFLAGADRGYFILEADAGLGKTAFLAHLAKERRWIQHFVELARGQDGVRYGLQSLAAQIVFRWKPDMAGAPLEVSRPDFLERLLFAAAASRDRSSPGQQIVIVVDGLDESAAFSDHNVMGLPRVLPSGVYLVVSKRPVHVTLEIETPRWRPVRLESAAPSNLDDVREFLETVARGERVASLLAESAIAPADFVSAFIERSQGVWIYLHYVLEELERGERRPLDLEALPWGLWAYYAKYWQARRASSDWDTVQLPLLAALAAAQEEVSASLLCAFAGIPETPRVARLLEEWRPFLAGSTGGERRYRCYHASFREFLEGRADSSRLTVSEQLLADELVSATAAAHNRIADRALETWGGLDAGLEGLQDRARRDLDGGYALRHVVAHLESAGRLADLSRLLLAKWKRGEGEENAWYAVHEKTQDLTGYLSDVYQVWAAAEAASEAAIARNEPAATVTLEARCALLISSVRQLAGLVRPRLQAALVEKGVWEPKHAFRYASAIVNAGERLLAMAHLLPLLPEALREKAFDGAVAAARWSNAEALAELPADLPRALLQAILTQVRERAWSKGRDFAALVPKLPADLLAEVLAFLDIADPKQDWSELLLALIPLVPPAERETLLARGREAAGQLYGETERLVFRLRLARFVSPEECARIAHDALQYARTKTKGRGRALLLARVLPCLQGHELESVAGEALEATGTMYSWDFKEVLPELIPQLPPKFLRNAEKRFLSKDWNWDSHFRAFLPIWQGQPVRLESALAKVEKLWRGYDKDQALAALVPLLPDALVNRALAAALASGGAPVALDALAPRLTSAQLDQAVSSLLATGVSATIYPRRETASDTGEPDEAPGPGSVKAKALQFLERRIPPDPREKAETLFATALLSEGTDRERLLTEGIAFIRSGGFKGYVEELPRDLVVAIAPELPEQLLRDVLAWTTTLQRGTDIAPILRAVIPRLPEAAAAEALLFDPDGWPVMAPPGLEMRADGSSPPRFLKRLSTLIRKTIRSGSTPEKLVLDAASFLPRRMRARVLLRIAQANGGWMFDEAVEAAGHFLAPAEQSAVLVGLLSRLSWPDFVRAAGRALIAILSLRESAGRAAALEAIATQVHPYFERRLRRAASAIRSGAGMGEAATASEALDVLAQTASADVLLRCLDRLSEEQREPVLIEAKQIIERLGSSVVQAWVLLQLVPYLPESESAEIVRSSLTHHAFATAAPYLIESWGRRQSPFPASVVRAAVLDRYVRNGSEVWIAIAPHLPDSVLAEALDNVWRVSGEKRDLALGTFAARLVALPSGQLHSLWQEALEKVAGEERSSSKLHALLPIADRLGGRYDLCPAPTNAAPALGPA
ncbi:MAG TPA: DUF4062 domain-containing protein [Thermoanaerobaculia bacterium]|nr:DUF4062 domain-containing protein [Thermoanaerobaculia bacterium]